MFDFLATKWIAIKTRNPGLDQKWSTLDQKWSNPKIFFWDFWSGIFAQNFILVNYSRSWKNILGISIPSCIFRLDQKWSRVDQIWSNLGFRVWPLLVQVGLLLVQPRVSSTDTGSRKKDTKYWALKPLKNVILMLSKGS